MVLFVGLRNLRSSGSHKFHRAGGIWTFVGGVGGRSGDVAVDQTGSSTPVAIMFVAVNGIERCRAIVVNGHADAERNTAHNDLIIVRHDDFNYLGHKSWSFHRQGCWDSASGAGPGLRLDWGRAMKHCRAGAFEGVEQVGVGQPIQIESDPARASVGGHCWSQLVALIEPPERVAWPAA